MNELGYRFVLEGTDGMWPLNDLLVVSDIEATSKHPLGGVFARDSGLFLLFLRNYSTKDRSFEKLYDAAIQGLVETPRSFIERMESTLGMPLASIEEDFRRYLRRIHPDLLRLVSPLTRPVDRRA